MTNGRVSRHLSEAQGSTSMAPRAGLGKERNTRAIRLPSMRALILATLPAVVRSTVAAEPEECATHSRAARFATAG